MHRLALVLNALGPCDAWVGTKLDNSEEGSYTSSSVGGLMGFWHVPSLLDGFLKKHEHPGVDVVLN